MGYPFKDVAHREYRNTFLKDVRVAVEFPAPSKKVEPERLRSFFGSFDGAQVDVEEFLKNQKIRVFSYDNKIDFHFEMGYAELKICTPTYKTIEHSSGLWTLLADYLSALEVERINRLYVRKYSTFEFRINQTDFDARMVMNTVFCKDLMDLMPKSKNNQRLTTIENTYSESDEASRTSIRIVYGFKKSDTAEKPNHLTLVNLVASEDGPFPMNEYGERVLRYNKILFDAFHWCVRPDIIKAMDQ